MNNKRRAIQKWGGLVILAGFVLGFAALAILSGWEETLAQIKKLSAWQLGLMLLLSLSNYLARAVRWHLYTGALELGTSFLQDMRHYLGGFAMTVTPGRVGELIRLRWIARETGHKLADTAPLALVDRAADLMSVGFLLAGSLAFSATGISGGIPVAVGAVAMAIVATRPTLFQWVITRGWKVFGIFPRLFARTRRAARQLHVFSKGRVLLPAIILGAIGWFAEGAAFYLLLIWMEAPLPLSTAIAIFLFSMLSGGVTGMPGGIGGAEAAMVGLLALQGMPLETAIAATLIIRATTLWFAILIGIGVFPFAERNARQVT